MLDFDYPQLDFLTWRELLMDSKWSVLKGKCVSHKQVCIFWSFVVRCNLHNYLIKKKRLLEPLRKRFCFGWTSSGGLYAILNFNHNFRMGGAGSYIRERVPKMFSNDSGLINKYNPRFSCWWNWRMVAVFDLWFSLRFIYSIEKYEKTGLSVLSRFKLESEPEKERKNSCRNNRVNYKVAYSVKMIWRVYSPFLNAHALAPSHITNSNWCGERLTG